MSSAVDFHSQIASIMEVLANAAVAEICKVVDDGYAVVQLEMSRSQKENEFLRRKIKLLDLQVARYRAERTRGSDGSGGSRFPGVRLLNRHSREPPTGPNQLSRPRFLNRSPEPQRPLQKTQPINLDQDPDQEVVTTTKTELAEPEDDELLIVKVEGAVESSGIIHEPAVDGCISTRGHEETVVPLAPGSEDAGDTRAARGHSETEGQGCPKNMSCAQNKEENLDEAILTAGGNCSSSQTQQDWQENSHTEVMEQSSCSTYSLGSHPGSSSFSQTRTNTCRMTSGSQKPNQDADQESIMSTFNISHSLPPEVEQGGMVALLSKRGGGGGLADQENVGGTSDYQSILSVHIPDPPTDTMIDGNRAHRYHLSTFNNPAVALGTVESQQQQTQHPWSGVPQGDAHFSNQNRLFPQSTSENRESGPVQPQLQQQECLPYACTFCSRRYAHQCQLRIHERVHTGEKPYQCTQCGKSFGQFCSLKRHQMVHTGERPFPCPHCGKQFSTSTNLKVHQSVHTGEKKFHCAKCGKNFSFLSNLIRHQALHSAK
ncbi:zinc finger protein with KRAB and SCAN domains 3-like isoform X2 [Thalassophryne amazonica]|uniref:zinc finger protein with KRAB and SCAN domains 3-like isoform X2 n=1 Tax=Thalassophryne amazonica TaxID=390379 RepID=UPI001470CD71|nr:zinc finger protein with KRAB and SCAN domains 3-like isoform X2 [Thalassophryne amazonica]